ncbi:MCE family protein [Campylobacter sp. RM12920]|uniref:MCE family protein n=1 Tax=Campylobacter californiensis TaxID=1032243 RepID=A0ABD4JGL8_9BACT|nr:MCE family protein [Campylobacter sp. RM12919]MBE2988110.1 MCE family protein [Campylobacter sp. RM12920]
MENRNSYTIVGMFFITCLSALAVFIWWMTNNDTKLDYVNYYIRTNELPSGVKADSLVKFIGVPAGSVSRIDFVKDSSALIEITLKIRDDLPIKKDSVASIELHPISGVATINISRGTQDFKKDERLVLELEASLFSKLGNNAQNITEKLSQSLDKLDNFFSDKNMAHLQSILENIDVFTKELNDKESMANAKVMVENLKNITSDFEKAQIKELVSNLNGLVDSSNSFVVSADKNAKEFSSLQQLLRQKLQDGEYDLKNALSPTMLEATKFLSDFQKTLREFRGALYRLEDNPYEFFFKDVENKKQNGE